MTLSDDVCRCAQCTKEEIAVAAVAPPALYLGGSEIIDRDAEPSLASEMIEKARRRIERAKITRTAQNWWC